MANEKQSPIESVSFRGEKRLVYRGQLIVKLDREAAAKSKTALHDICTRALGREPAFEILRDADDEGVALIEMAEGANLDAVASMLEEAEEVDFVEPNPVNEAIIDSAMALGIESEPAVIPRDPLFNLQWHLQTINTPAAWGVTQGSGDVCIAVVDSGIAMQGSPAALSHEDLDDGQRFFTGENYSAPGTPPLDDHGHGTHVTGIAAAEGNNGQGIAGVCWRCRVYVTKVFDQQGNGSGFSLYQAVRESVAFASARGWRLVINYSGGGRGYARIYEQAAQAALSGGALLCAAAGNDFSRPVNYPAALSTRPDGSVWYPNVIAVSATTRGDTFADFSNRGIQINLAAPGQDILSTMPDYAVTMNGPPYNNQMNYDAVSGTSMATPLVSGVAALVWAVEPSFTAVQVKDRLQTSAVDLGAAGRDPFFGFGRLNAYGAVRPPPPPPPPPPPQPDPWDNPQVQQFINEWLRQQDRCVKAVYPGAYIDKWGRLCGNTGGGIINCSQSPDCPPGWTNYRYLWANNWCPGLYSYRIQDYVRRRQAGQSYGSLAQCKSSGGPCL